MSLDRNGEDPMAPLVDIGLFHRLGIAVRGDGEGAARWFADTLGAEMGRSSPEPGDTHWTTRLRIGPTMIAMFAAAEDDTTGTITLYRRAYQAS